MKVIFKERVKKYREYAYRKEIKYMNSKNKINTKKNMDKLINSLGSLIASAGCRFILYQPEIPKKIVKKNKEKN